MVRGRRWPDRCSQVHGRADRAGLPRGSRCALRRPLAAPAAGRRGLRSRLVCRDAVRAHQTLRLSCRSLDPDGLLLQRNEHCAALPRVRRLLCARDPEGRRWAPGRRREPERARAYRGVRTARLDQPAPRLACLATARGLPRRTDPGALHCRESTLAVGALVRGPVRSHGRRGPGSHAQALARARRDAGSGSPGHAILALA